MEKYIVMPIMWSKMFPFGPPHDFRDDEQYVVVLSPKILKHDCQMSLVYLIVTDHHLEISSPIHCPC